MHPKDRADLRALQRAQDRAELTERLERQLVTPLEGEALEPAARDLLKQITDALELAQEATAETVTAAASTRPTPHTPPHSARIAPTSSAPRVALINVWGDDLTAVEAARVSTGGLEHIDTAAPSPVDLTANTRPPSTPQQAAKDERLLSYLWTHAHTSPFEHAGATFALSVPLFVARQVMRHRTLSYNEISRRYTSEGLEIWTPAINDMRPQHSRALQCSREGERIERASELSAKMRAHAHASAALYEELISAGLAREVARAVLPTATYTRFYVSGNLLNILKMIRLRATSHAQPEARAVALEMAEVLRARFPLTLDLVLSSEEETP